MDPRLFPRALAALALVATMAACAAIDLDHGIDGSGRIVSQPRTEPASIGSPWRTISTSR